MSDEDGSLPDFDLLAINVSGALSKTRIGFSSSAPGRADHAGPHGASRLVR